MTAATNTISFGVGGICGTAYKGVMGSISATGVGGVIARTAMTGLQSYATSSVSSAINAIQWDGNGFGWSADAFNAGMRSGGLGALSAMAGTVASGMMNLGLEGFVGETYANGAQLSSFTGGLASQGVNYATGQGATFNVARFGGVGLMELHLGKGGMTMNLGMGGSDASFGTIASSIAGLDAWRVNAELLFSDQEEAGKYTSAMRTAYSAGATERTLYNEILAGRTNVVEDSTAQFGAETTRDSYTGIKTITLGSEALADGSRFGLNILFSHESYRNGVDDGVVGQRVETDQAALGHIRTAGALAAIYGDSSLDSDALREVDAYRKALQPGGSIGELAKIVGNYDSSADYWKLMANGDLVDDGQGWLKDQNGNFILDNKGNKIGADGKETGLLNILYGGTNNRAYSQFSDAQIATVQQLMEMNRPGFAGEPFS